ncbi:hypothetical protein Patl1_07211 [Pistacia atlantica]|uniref:Uncharacterized protein n=1 Tax=Pistacia atlantica TaxID=434234 RepID=A0ACC1AH35_9ROSI|nr:hypothetical protein Patl1_07211 [Pistacia atlantica]
MRHRSKFIKFRTNVVSQDYIGYTPYSNSSGIHKVMETQGYPSYYSYQQQPNHSYSQPVGAYQNAGEVLCASKMANVVENRVGGSFGDANDAQKNVFDLGAFVGDLTFEEDASGEFDYSQVFLNVCVKLVAGNLRGSPLEAFAWYFLVKMLIACSLFWAMMTLEGVEKELEEFVIWGTRSAYYMIFLYLPHEVVENILSKGTTLREYMKGVENDLRQVEVDSIQDYIKESDNLLFLHDQIRDGDAIVTDGDS